MLISLGCLWFLWLGGVFLFLRVPYNFVLESLIWKQPLYHSYVVASCRKRPSPVSPARDFGRPCKPFLKMHFLWACACNFPVRTFTVFFLHCLNHWALCVLQISRAYLCVTVYSRWQRIQPFLPAAPQTWDTGLGLRLLLLAWEIWGPLLPR